MSDKRLKPHIRHAKLYRFWIAELKFDRVTFSATGPTPKAAYESLLMRPTASNVEGYRIN